MNEKTKRIQYLTRKAQRGAITQIERNELASLLGKNPNEFDSENGLPNLIGFALIVIAVAIIADIVKGVKK
ncbi:MAG: hypothetical protein JNJ41_16400 [Bacteroidia bacterium]|nr:hypothetical protein [Bacteroidia bacterium]